MAFSENEHWAIRLCDFPRLQIIFFLFLSIIIFSCYLFENRLISYSLIALLSIAMIFQICKVWPYTTMNKFQVRPAMILDSSNHLSMVYCNVYMENRNSEEALRQMTKYDPDLILAVETDQWWADQLKVLSKKYSYSVEMPLNNTYGMILYSKLPFENKEFRFLVNEQVPSLNPVITLPSGQNVQCYFIHPKPPNPKEVPSSIERDKELIMIAKEAKACNIPVIVAGDLNDVGWSFTSELFQKTSGLLDPRVGRGFYSTFNAKYPFFRWPLDHVFTSTDFRLVDINRLDKMGSDHFPIYVKISFEPENSDENRPIYPDKEDEKKANEKLKKED